MTVEVAVRSRIASLTPVTALVSTRVYLGKLPQSPTYPCVRVSLVDALQGQHLRGLTDVEQARVQVDCYAHEASGVDPYASATALDAAVMGDGNGLTASGLAGWIGVVVGSISDRAVLNVAPMERLMRYDPLELRVLTSSRDYMVWSREAT